MGTKGVERSPYTRIFWQHIVPSTAGSFFPETYGNQSIANSIDQFLLIHLVLFVGGNGVTDVIVNYLFQFEMGLHLAYISKIQKFVK